MTINANAMRSIALGNNVFRNIAFALANCEEELCGAISSNSPISRCDKPSNTDILNIFGSSGKWSDKFSIEQKKTAEHFVYLNNHKQIYNNEQQFSISCMGALQP